MYIKPFRNWWYYTNSQLIPFGMNGLCRINYCNIIDPYFSQVKIIFIFKRHRYPREMILQAVYFKLRFTLS